MNGHLTLAASTIFAVLISSASAQEAASSARGQVAVAHDRDNRIDGEWRGLGAKSSLDTQLALSLFSDGSYVQRMVIVTEFAWTAEPKLLNIAPVTRKGADVSYGQAMSVRMTVNQLSLTTRFQNDSIVLYRLGGSPGDSSLIGRWQGENAAGEEVIEEFAPDGRLFVMVTVARDAGRFNVAADEIEWRQQIPSEGKRISKFRMEGNKLTLFDEQKRPVEFLRGPVQPPTN